MNPVKQIAERFAARQVIVDIQPLGNGLINDTYQVTTLQQRFVLQRLNGRVFERPEQVIANLQQLSQHIQRQVRVQLQIPGLLATIDGEMYCRDNDKQLWRALAFVAASESREVLNHDAEAAQIGFALAHFHRLCHDLSPSCLFDTLPGFHIAPTYYRQYLDILRRSAPLLSDLAVQQCCDYIDGFQTHIAVLEQAKQAGVLVERVIHGDPKLNNFLFKVGSNQIISLIDLDTVKPGLWHYDIGDCLRSCCHVVEENRFDLRRCQIILQHYLQEMRGFFSSADYDYLYDAIRLIPFELGLRFFSDYLNGNRYFKVDDPQQNLRRAQAQFQLCDSITQQSAAIVQMIAALRAMNPAVSASNTAD